MNKQERQQESLLRFYDYMERACKTEEEADFIYGNLFPTLDIAVCLLDYGRTMTIWLGDKDVYYELVPRRMASADEVCAAIKGAAEEAVERHEQAVSDGAD